MTERAQRTLAVGTTAALLFVILLVAWESYLGDGYVEAEQLPRRPAPQLAVDVNTAPAEELMLLPNIGETMAARIIEARQATPFQTAEELLKVRGIGPKTLARLRPYLWFPPELAASKPATNGKKLPTDVE